VTDKDLKTYDALLRSKADVHWMKEDVQKLMDEVRRLRDLLATERPVALRDHWVGMPRFVGGH
jgi:hypothetical protein